MDKDGAHAVTEKSVRETTLIPAQEKPKVCADD
jgi:hypothetical protein